MTDKSVSFGKLENVDYQKFKGISKNSVKDNKLTKSIFEKYDTNGGVSDGILDETELAAMQKDLSDAAKTNGNSNLGKNEAKQYINKKLGAEGTGEDLQKFYEAASENDNIAKVDINDGKTTVRYKADENGFSRSETFHLSDKGEKVYDTVTREKGAITEYLDPAHNDRVTRKSTQKGNNLYETVMYDYNDKTGAVTEIHFDANNKKTKSVTSNNGNEISHTDYTYENGKEIAVETTGKLVTKTVTQDGKPEQKAELDEQGNTKGLEYDVKNGENWYQIVQDKYGVKDHKTIMNIVHQLKANEHVDIRSSVMPDTITLPPKMTVGSKDYVLKNADAAKEGEKSVSNDKTKPQTETETKAVTPETPQKAAHETQKAQGAKTIEEPKAKETKKDNKAAQKTEAKETPKPERKTVTKKQDKAEIPVADNKSTKTEKTQKPSEAEVTQKAQKADLQAKKATQAKPNWQSGAEELVAEFKNAKAKRKDSYAVYRKALAFKNTPANKPYAKEITKYFLANGVTAANSRGMVSKGYDNGFEVETYTHDGTKYQVKTTRWAGKPATYTGMNNGKVVNLAKDCKTKNEAIMKMKQWTATVKTLANAKNNGLQVSFQKVVDGLMTYDSFKVKIGNYTYTSTGNSPSEKVNYENFVKYMSNLLGVDKSVIAQKFKTPAACAK